MTEKDFWDKFNSKHNPKFHYAKIKNQKEKQTKSNAGWSNTKDLNKEKLPTCVSKGYLVSQAKGVTRIFTDYIKTKDKDTFDNIGNTTIIPTAVIVSIKKIN